MNAKWAVIFLLAATSLALSQSSSSKIFYYDTFSQPRISPNRWLPALPESWGNPLEVVREISNGQLRLALRNVGNTDSNSGWQWAQDQLYFVSPGPIRSIISDINVIKAHAMQCAANTDTTSGVQAQIGGAFFNTGTGNAGQDVWALLIVGPNMPDQKDLIAALWWGTSDGAIGVWTTIGEFPFGKPLTARLKWDNVKHKFTGSILTDGVVLYSVDAPYTISDTTAAVNPAKALAVVNTASNCLGIRIAAESEAWFDNVAINQ